MDKLFLVDDGCQVILKVNYLTLQKNQASFYSSVKVCTTFLALFAFVRMLLLQSISKGEKMKTNTIYSKQNILLEHG